ncbi:MAG TPA: enoyl-CoA hydratase-related protein [Acidimicrobiales bacterium]|nr:enoyl-CoA hydratase-related protein [Acidimicrobiales bacterium]
MTYKNETILVDIDGGVATVTLNRPDAHNAMDAAMLDEFHAALRGLDADPAVRAIVLTGAGKSYCAGVDISSGADAFHQDENSALEADAAMVVDNFSLWRLRTPLIGAINGAAIGAGLTLALLVDIVFVADDAKLSFRFSRLGILPEANSLWLLPRLVGIQHALDLLLSGRDFSGAEAAAIGLVKQAVPRAELLATAQAYARDIADNASPMSTALIKRLTYQYLQETDRGAAMTEETDWTWWTGTQPDIVEAMTARMERRAPQWITTKLDVPDKLPPRD